MYGNGRTWATDSIGTETPPPPGTWRRAAPARASRPGCWCRTPGMPRSPWTSTLMTSTGEFQAGPPGRGASRPSPAAPSTWATTSPTTTSPPWSTADGRRGGRAGHVRQRPHLGHRLHRHRRPRRHLVPGGGLHRRGLRDLGAGAEPRGRGGHRGPHPDDLDRARRTRRPCRTWPSRPSPAAPSA